MSLYPDMAPSSDLRLLAKRRRIEHDQVIGWVMGREKVEDVGFAKFDVRPLVGFGIDARRGQRRRGRIDGIDMLAVRRQM